VTELCPGAPLYYITNEFWDKEALLSESLECKVNALEWTKSGAIVRAVPMSEKTPALVATYNKFMELYPHDWGDTIGSYMYINAGESYPWHTDVDAQNKMSIAPKGVLCAINIVLTGEQNSVDFQGKGSWHYKAALFNTSETHRISPTTDRIIFRISFRDKSYEEAVKIIEAINNIPTLREK
tara:strand:- start:492 stop:1037 length:546 start_codon:yes stop_codon:yes gene_type:complete